MTQYVQRPENEHAKMTDWMQVCSLACKRCLGAAMTVFAIRLQTSGHSQVKDDTFLRLKSRGPGLD
jgi:hypothetical protein